MIKLFKGITEYNEAFDNGFKGKAVVLVYFDPILMNQRIMGRSQLILEGKEGWTVYHEINMVRFKS